MYYEEKLINGILMFRYSPDGDWSQHSIEKMSAIIVEMKANLSLAETFMSDKHYNYYLECKRA